MWLRLAPQRTLLLAFGHDEEVGGTRGALAIAGLLAAEGTQLEYVLDEGSPLLADGLAPFMTDRAVALVGTAEKERSRLNRHSRVHEASDQGLE